MMRNLDFSSWQSLVTTVVGLVAITAIAVGIRLLLMQTIQQRRERENRQINERLRTLIAAYKTLGGSFTGVLVVDPSHLSDLRRRQIAESSAEGIVQQVSDEILGSTDRSRRIRDAVEAALSDVILLGTEEQVRLAAQAANELVEGRTIHTAELVISLRNFIRQVLDLEVIPAEMFIPRQGPARPGAGSNAVKGKGAEGGDRDGSRQGGKGGGVEGGLGMGIGFGGAHAFDDGIDDKH
jgi:hypothetical protein